MDTNLIDLSQFNLFETIPGSTGDLMQIMKGIVLALVFIYIIAIKPDILIQQKIFSEEKINAARNEF